jgi:hypothetical protein
MEITNTELQQLLDQQMEKYIAHLRQALRELGIEAKKRKWVSQAEAYRLFGKTNVKRWVERGQLPVYSDGDGNRKRIYIADLERVASKNNRQYGKDNDK